MKKWAIILIVLIAGTARPEYLLYEQETGNILSHAKVMDVETNANGTINYGVTRQIVLVGSTTNDMDATFYINVSQLVLVPEDAKSIRRTPEWTNLVATLDGYAPAMDAVTNAIAAESGTAKAADNALKNAIKQLQDEIRALKKIVGVDAKRE